MRNIYELYSLKDQISFELLEADSERYEELLEELEQVEAEIEELQELYNEEQDYE
jgi:hypothetical protein